MKARNSCGPTVHADVLARHLQDVYILGHARADLAIQHLPNGVLRHMAVGQVE